MVDEMDEGIVGNNNGNGGGGGGWSGEGGGGGSGGDNVINYYSISGENLRRYYYLEKGDGYYDFELSVREAEELNSEDIDKLSIIRLNKAKYMAILRLRRSRENILRRELSRLGVRFIGHSYLTVQYIMYGRYDLQYVVNTLYKMKILFENLGIEERWSRYKLDSNRIFFSMEDKDKFYDEVYYNNMVGSGNIVSS